MFRYVPPTPAKPEEGTRIQLNISSTLSQRQGLFGIVASSERDADSTLIRSAKAGDSHAYGILWERYRTPLARYFYGKTAHRDETDDLVSDTLSTALLQLSDYAGSNNASFRTYIYSIAKNKFTDWLRKKPKTPLRFSEMDDADSEDDSAADSLPAMENADPLVLMLDQGETDALCCALADMALRSPEQLAAISLHYGCQMSHKDIAALYEMQATTVNTRLQEGRRTLKRHYEREASAASTLV